MSTFDPIAALASANLDRLEAPTRKLSFSDQCAAFAALKGGEGVKGFHRTVVAKAFGITVNSASTLANCLRRAPGRVWRYHQVAREYERLGDEEFTRRYYSEEIHLRLTRLKLEVPKPGDDRRPRGPNRYADQYARPFQIGHSTMNIEWAVHPYNQTEGWWLTGGSEKLMGAEWLGDDPGNPVPFRTSAEAFDGAFKMRELPSPRRR